MTTDLIMELIRNNWWIWAFIIGATSYTIYSTIRYYAELKKLKDRKKELEGKLAGLEAQYIEKAKKLEEKLNEGKKFYRGG